jgi:hypothetical protein
MPATLIDRTGNVFGEWTVLSFVKREKNTNYWLCKCSCGNTKTVIFNSLQKQKSTSCGCKAIAKRSKKLTKHGMAGTPTYKSWHAMLQRSQGKGGHESYVERNITVCPDWIKFENFLSDMGVRPDGKTLDRIDNTKGYYKDNCRWATPSEQQNNMKSNAFIYVFGERMTITRASKLYSIGISCLRHRLRKGMNPDLAVTMEKK